MKNTNNGSGRLSSTEMLDALLQSQVPHLVGLAKHFESLLTSVNQLPENPASKNVREEIHHALQFLYEQQFSKIEANHHTVLQQDFLLHLRKPGLHETLHELLRLSMELMEAQMGQIQLYDPETKMLETEAISGFSEAYYEKFKKIDLAVNPPFGKAILKKKRIIIPDIDADTAYTAFHNEVRTAGYQSVQSTPLHNDDNELIGILSTFWRSAYQPNETQLFTLDLYALQAAHYISRYRTEQALCESEEVFRKLVQANAQATWETDAKGIIVKDSPTWRNYTGQTLQEWLGHGWLDAIHPDDRYAIERLWREAIENVTNLNAEFRLRYAYGDYRWTNILAVPILENGQVCKWVGMNIDIDARKKAEEAVRESDQQLKRAIEAARAVMWEWYPGDNKVVMTANTLQLFGVAHPNIPQWDFIHETDRQSHLEKVKAALRNGKSFESQFRLTRPDNGQTIWIEDRVRTIKDKWGNITALVGAAIDITASKQAIEAMQRSEKKLSAIFSGAEVGLSELDPHGNFIRVNNKICKILGRSRKELLQLSVPAVTHPEDVPPSMEAVAKALETGKPVSLDKRYNRPDGTLVWANSTISVHQNEYGEPFLLAVTADLTERKKAEEILRRKEEEYTAKLKEEVRKRTKELNESRDFLQAVFDSSLDMIQVFKAVRDDSGKIVDFVWLLNNNVSENVYGDMIGQSLLENNPGVRTTGIFDKFVEVVQTGIPQQYELEYVHEQFDGWFHQSVVKMDDGVVTSTANITARKRTEQQNTILGKKLQAQNRELESLNAELRTFNSIAVNDYQQTLHTLYVNLEHLIQTDAPRLSDTSKANVRRAQSAVQKMKLLTDDIVAFSKLPVQDNIMQGVDLNEIAATVLAEYGDLIKEKSAIIEAEFTLPVILGHPLLIKLLFHHLIGNALKFSEPGKSVKISFGYQLVREREVHSSYENELLHEVSITDNGIGFDQQDALQIFNIFVRLHDRNRFKGSGVGLAMCRKIMEIHSGFIEAVSSVGNGSTFKCYFPVTETIES